MNGAPQGPLRRSELRLQPFREGDGLPAFPIKAWIVCPAARSFISGSLYISFSNLMLLVPTDATLGLYEYLVVKACRGSIVGVSLDHREPNLVSDPFAVSEADVAKQPNPSDFHPNLEFRIVHDPRGVCLLLADANLLFVPASHCQRGR